MRLKIICAFLCVTGERLVTGASVGEQVDSLPTYDPWDHMAMPPWSLGFILTMPGGRPNNSFLEICFKRTSGKSTSRVKMWRKKIRWDRGQEDYAETQKPWFPVGGSTLATEAKMIPPVGKMLLRFPGLPRAPHPAVGWVHTHTRWIKARTAFLDLISILPHLATTPRPSTK